MTNEIKNIKNSLKRLEHFEKLSNQAYDAWEADPMNPDKEEAANKAYKLEYNEFIYAAHLISKFSGIDERTACTIVKGQREKLMQILAD